MQTAKDTYHTCIVCGQTLRAEELVYGPDQYAEDVLGLTREFGWRCKKCESKALASSNFF